MRFPDYYGIGMDLYGELSYYGCKLFRVYRTALAKESYELMAPDTAFNICRPPRELYNWNKADWSRKKILQEIDPKAKSVFEYSYPIHMLSLIHI